MLDEGLGLLYYMNWNNNDIIVCIYNIIGYVCFVVL